MKEQEQVKIVTIGGGTGQSPLLQGLKQHPYDITAIVTMADDGGSTGVLRDELGVLPPGDAQKCLVALSESSAEMRSLMGYRFEEGRLEGHSVGNLFLSALEKVHGSFSSGIAHATDILNVRGRVLPSSEGDMRLQITLKDGTVLNGEKHLDDNKKMRSIGIAEVTLEKSVRAHKESVKAVEEADYVIIGPGDMYGSLLPNLLVRGIAQAVKKSQATVIFIAPLTNKKGHSEKYVVDDYIRTFENYIGKGRINYAVVNTQKPAKAALALYEKMEGDGSFVTLGDIDRDVQYRTLTGDFLSRKKVQKVKGDKIAAKRAFIRHDAERLAGAVAYLIEYKGQDPFDIR